MIASNSTKDESRLTAAALPARSRGPDPLIGRIINERYRIISLLACGGMGKVYRAEQAALGRPVALKILNPSQGGEGDPEFQRRFFLEAATSSKLRHPNTVTIFDYGKTEDAVYYIAMELLEGRTLHRALKDEGTLSPQRTMLIASEICRSLREAHGIGVIHRDLKPANVYLVRHDDRDENEAVKVLDFGLVKNVKEEDEHLTKTGIFMGSPKYMAPEQIRSEPGDARADVYCLGVVMFEMLTGKPPFDHSTPVDTMIAHLTDPVTAMSAVNPKVEVPPALESLVRKCLEKAPDDRFATMNDLLHALQQCASSSLSLAMSGDFPLGAGLAPSMRSPSNGNSAVPAPAEPTPSGMPDCPSAAPQAPFAQATKAGVGVAPLFLAAVFALTGVGGFVALCLPSAPSRTPTHALVSSAGKNAQPTPSRDEKRDAASKKLVVSLSSTPPGATVLVGTHKYGPTPAHVVWTGAQAIDGRSVTFRFRLKGYKDLTLTQEVHGDPMEVETPPMELSPAEGL